MSNMYADKSKGKWAIAHNNAIGGTRFKGCTGTMESCIVASLDAWSRYATAHNARFESLIGDDYVLGPEWKAVGLALRGLLNGETGALDCGTLDAFILDTLNENGINTENL